MEDADDFVEGYYCPICRAHYVADSQEHDPVVIGYCGHTVCISCRNRNIERRRPRCPLPACRSSECFTEADGVVQNYLITEHYGVGLPDYSQVNVKRFLEVPHLFVIFYLSSRFNIQCYLLVLLYKVVTSTSDYTDWVAIAVCLNFFRIGYISGEIIWYFCTICPGVERKYGFSLTPKQENLGEQVVEPLQSMETLRNFTDSPTNAQRNI